MASATNAIPLVLGSLLGVMLAVLCVVLLLFYKKRKESIEFKPLEKMTRGLKKMSKSVKSQSQKSKSSNDNLPPNSPQTPVLRNTQFWVPEVYNTIIQPSPAPIRKASRLQSTLDREIYSKAPDTSYLQATESHEVLSDTKKCSFQKNAPSRESQRRLMSEPLNRGMLNFSLQYKQDKAVLYIVVIKAEGLVKRQREEYCDPFVDIQVSPFYKRRMHSEVHQKTQNPIFNQQFEFEVPPYEIREQSVTFTVLDFNQQLVHETIGSVEYNLDSLDNDAFFAGKEFTLWKKIDINGLDAADKTDSGQYREFPVTMDLNKTEMLLLLSVRYLKVAERLTVNINKARNLLPLDRKGRLDHPYVSVSLKHNGRTIKKLRTGVVKHDINPIFNKNMVFEVTGPTIDQVILTVKLRHHNEIGRDRTFAIIKIGKNTGGSGELQWTDMLASNGASDSENIERWHCLIPIEPTDD